MNISKLQIDPQCLGERMFLTEILPAHEYKDKKRTKNIQDYRYVAAHGLEKLGIKSDSNQGIKVIAECHSTAGMEVSLWLNSTRRSGRLKGLVLPFQSGVVCSGNFNQEV